MRIFEVKNVNFGEEMLKIRISPFHSSAKSVRLPATISGIRKSTSRAANCALLLFLYPFFKILYLDLKFSFPTFYHNRPGFWKKNNLKTREWLNFSRWTPWRCLRPLSPWTWTPRTSPSAGPKKWLSKLNARFWFLAKVVILEILCILEKIIN